MTAPTKREIDFTLEIVQCPDGYLARVMCKGKRCAQIGPVPTRELARDLGRSMLDGAKSMAREVLAQETIIEKNDRQHAH